MTDEALLRQALDALELHAKQYPHMQKGYTVDAIAALRERLAQPEQEPVSLNDGRLTHYPDGSIGVGTPAEPIVKWDASAPLVVHPHPAFQAAPPQRKPEQRPAPPPWWPAVENILTEYGLQAIDFVDDFKKALAQPEQEPVAWMCSDFVLMHRGYSRFSPIRQGDWNIPVYTTPPRREWVELTLEEIGLLTTGDGWSHLETPALALFARAIEAKLREKNA